MPEYPEACLASLPEYRDLSCFVSRLTVPLLETAKLRHAKAGAVQQAKDHAISGVPLKCKHPLDVSLRKNTFRAGVLGRGGLDCRRYVEGQVANAVPE